MENLQFENSPKDKLDSYEAFLKVSIGVTIMVAVIVFGMYLFLV